MNSHSDDLDIIVLKADASQPAGRTDARSGS